MHPLVALGLGECVASVEIFTLYSSFSCTGLKRRFEAEAGSKFFKSSESEKTL